MEVLWGLYDTNRILKSQAEGQADDVANVLIPIIPLFAILIACFIYKELDKWFRSNFDVTIHTDYRIERETRRLEIKKERDIYRENKALEERLREEALAFGKSSDAGSKKDDEEKDKEDGAVDDEKKDDGEDKKEAEDEKEEEQKYFDADGKEINLDKDGDLPGLVLKSLLRKDPETVEQYRGDRAYEAGVTNQYLIDML
jgi:hypothetical protein